MLLIGNSVPGNVYPKSEHPGDAPTCLRVSLVYGSRGKQGFRPPEAVVDCVFIELHGIETL